MKPLSFLKALCSPFKPFKLKWYIGKVAIGTPYFLPRKWVKATPELIHNAVLKHIEREESYNKINPKDPRKIKPYDELYKEKSKYLYTAPKKIGFDFVGLGWKTKWTDTDYRFEWSPLISFVFFKWQIALIVVAPEENHYWEAWLYYENNTDKSLSQEERIKQCIEAFPLKYTVYSDNEKKSVNFYFNILKKKYHKYINTNSNEIEL